MVNFVNSSHYKNAMFTYCAEVAPTSPTLSYPASYGASLASTTSVNLQGLAADFGFKCPEKVEELSCWQGESCTRTFNLLPFKRSFCPLNQTAILADGNRGALWQFFVRSRRGMPQRLVYYYYS